MKKQLRKIKDYLNDRPALKTLVIPLLLAYRKMQASKLNDKINSGRLLDGLDDVHRERFIMRSNNIKSSSDNQYISRVPDAGKVRDGWLIMHNGLKVDPFSYYGLGALHMFVENKGVHEPQEERVFDMVLKTMPKGATMLEMGSFWSFYSMWFNKEVKEAKNYMIEPDPMNMRYGKINFKENKLHPTAFHQAFVGASSSKNKHGQETICVDDFVKAYNISFLDILHCDIQGYELEMLKGAVKTIESKKIGYAFISTHSHLLHEQCERFLLDYGYITLASANKDESFSFDGVLVMRAPYYEGIGPVDISIRVKEPAMA